MVRDNGMMAENRRRVKIWLKNSHFGADQTIVVKMGPVGRKKGISTHFSPRK
jgi:hypothetical protein